MLGASAPGDKTPLDTFVDDSVSRALIKYFEDKGDPGKQDFVAEVAYSETADYMHSSAFFILD